ncbi:MAG: FAD-dependent monooxygenase, partial [Candidatus Latescibacterota bacterium]
MFDLIVCGGGIAGSALARAMAEKGARVLLLERTLEFKDRVRGEGVHPWGVAEAEELGVRDLLAANCAREIPKWTRSFRPFPPAVRDLAATSLHGCGEMVFHHPDMQGCLLEAAMSAGAEVRRGIAVTAVKPGSPPSVEVALDGSTGTIPARFVVGADGRTSGARRSAGFRARRDPRRVSIAGVLLAGLGAPEESVQTYVVPGAGVGAFIFPIGDGRFRAYLCFHVDTGLKNLSGEKDLGAFLEACRSTGMPAEWFESAESIGPLATFDAAECWVDRPYAAGVALVGDAAATSDPTYGCGLALALRDVRVLRDALLADEDWDSAGRAYAEEHDRYFGALHRMEEWMRVLLYEVGPEADARRERAFPLLQTDPTRWPDLIG